MKLDNKGITVINFVLFVTIGILVIIGCIFGGTTMVINNKKDNFINTAKKYVEGAKSQLMSDDMMPSVGEAVIVPYDQINLGKEYNSPYSNSAFLEDYSYVVITKINQDNQAKDDYKYFVTQIDGKNNCLNLMDFDLINNYGSERRNYIKHDTDCSIESVLLVGNDFKLKDINLGHELKYIKYQKNVN